MPGSLSNTLEPFHATREEVPSYWMADPTRRRGQTSGMVSRATEPGETTPTAAQTLDHVVAPLYYCVVFALPVAPDYARRLVRDVLAMVH